MKISLPKLDCLYKQDYICHTDVLLVGPWGLCVKEFDMSTPQEFIKDQCMYEPVYIQDIKNKSYEIYDDIKQNGVGSDVLTLSDNYWHIPMVSHFSLIWGHWTDTLQKLYRLEIECGGQYMGKKFSYIFNSSSDKHPHVKEIKSWLKFFNIYDDRVLFRYDNNNSQIIKMPYSIAVAPVHYTSHASSEIMKKLRHEILFKISNPVKEKKLFLIRGKGEKRSIINDIELYPHLKSLGFELIDTNILKLSELQEIFSKASHIISLHHSGIKNCIFSDDGIKILELYPSKFKSKIDVSIMQCCKAMGCEYNQIVIESDENSNINIQPETLNKILTDTNFI